MEKPLLLQPHQPAGPETRPDPKALKILAKSVFRQLRAQGYEATQVIGFATEIIALVTSDIARDGDTTP